MKKETKASPLVAKLISENCTPEEKAGSLNWKAVDKYRDNANFALHAIRETVTALDIDGKNKQAFECNPVKNLALLRSVAQSMQKHEKEIDEVYAHHRFRNGKINTGELHIANGAVMSYSDITNQALLSTAETVITLAASLHGKEAEDEILKSIRTQIDDVRELLVGGGLMSGEEKEGVKTNE